MKVLILHLSDIHFSNDIGDNVIVRRKQLFIDIVLNGIFSINPDVIFMIVSGDIAYSGRVEEYKIAQEFLINIKSELEEKSGIKVITVAIPGNHDCNFDNHDQTRTWILESIWKNDNVNNLSLDENTLDNCLVVQKDFFTFIEDFQKVVDVEDIEYDPHPKAVPGKLEISGFFKCFFAYSSGVMLSSAEWGLNSL